MCSGISEEACLVQAQSNTQVNFRHKYVCITPFILEGIFQRLISANQRALLKCFNQWQSGWVSPPLRSLRNKYYHISVSWNLDTVFLLKGPTETVPGNPGVAQYKYSKDFKAVENISAKTARKNDAMVKYNLLMEEKGWKHLPVGSYFNIPHREM